MSRFTIVFMLTMTVVMAAHPTLAGSYAVGTCKPTLPSFASISVAVSSVPPSSTVLVCPGTYKEQVTISQPLTLQGHHQRQLSPGGDCGTERRSEHNTRPGIWSYGGPSGDGDGGSRHTH